VPPAFEMKSTSSEGVLPRLFTLGANNRAWASRRALGGDRKRAAASSSRNAIPYLPGLFTARLPRGLSPEINRLRGSALQSREDASTLN
jgi:hypothetical protein